jgi:hypothetical protein
MRAARLRWLPLAIGVVISVVGSLLVVGRALGA